MRSDQRWYGVTPTALLSPTLINLKAPESVQVQTILAALWIVACTFVFENPTLFVKHTYGSFGTDPLYTRAMFRFCIVLAAGSLSGWLLQAPGLRLLSLATDRLQPRTRRLTVIAAVLSACLLVSLFLIVCGRQQFGAWDYTIFIEVGWRQHLGQRPYVDFITPTPPLFNWTSALAFRVFGVAWNASLYLSAAFSSLTLIWAFLLFRAMGMRPFAALGTSLLIQTAAMLSCCFWWYNNTTLILAALFYLAALLLSHSPSSRFAEGSFVLLLGLLLLAKPNIAFVTVAGCVFLLLITSEHRGRIVLLALAGGSLAALLLFATHTSLSAMISTYRGIAKERGPFSAFGFHELSVGEQRLTLLWMPALCLPLLGVWRPLSAALRSRRWQTAASWFFFPLSVVVAIYGIAGNGELRDVECTLLIGALGLFAFASKEQTPFMRRLTVALMCGMAASDLYTGAARLRVYTVGAHWLYEWSDHDHRIGAGFLKDLRVSQTMVDIEAEITQALKESRGPVFFGPRLDFEYAVHGLVSPRHWPTFFQPGTAFGRSETPQLLQSWSAHRFPTVICVKEEYTFYPNSFLVELEKQYVRDDRYPRITVYRRRSGI